MQGITYKISYVLGKGENEETTPLLQACCSYFDILFLCCVPTSRAPEPRCLSLSLQLAMTASASSSGGRVWLHRGGLSWPHCDLANRFAISVPGRRHWLFHSGRHWQPQVSNVRWSGLECCRWRWLWFVALTVSLWSHGWAGHMQFALPHMI